MSKTWHNFDKNGIIIVTKFINQMPSCNGECSILPWFQDKEINLIPTKWISLYSKIVFRAYINHKIKKQQTGRGSGQQYITGKVGQRSRTRMSSRNCLDAICSDSVTPLSILRSINTCFYGTMWRRPGIPHCNQVKTRS